MAATYDAQTVALNESFTLSIGQTQRLHDSAFSITFIGIEYEGRCPTESTCIWQGDAAAKFEVRGDGPPQSITLHTLGSTHLPRHMEVLGRSVSMFNLTPYPRDDQKTPIDDYVAHMSIS
jgi:hypothetical protein